MGRGHLENLMNLDQVLSLGQWDLSHLCMIESLVLILNRVEMVDQVILQMAKVILKMAKVNLVINDKLLRESLSTPLFKSLYHTQWVDLLQLYHLKVLNRCTLKFMPITSRI